MSRFSNKQILISDRFHPAAVLVYFLILTAITMVLTHPLYLLGLFCVVLLGIAAAGALETWKRAMTLGIWLGFFIVAINLLVSRGGQTILWEGPSLAFLGPLTISLESFLFSLNMAFKLCLILSVFCFYEGLMPAHKAFCFFSRFTPKSALMLILTSLFLPQLKRRLGEVVTVMKTRGAEFEGGNILQKVRSRYPLLKILLVSSLEDSWQTAEALESRAFGTGKRTYFEKHVWQKRDGLVVSLALFSLLGFAAALKAGRGFLEFYPTIEMMWTAEEYFLISWILAGLAVFPFMGLMSRR